MSAVEGLPAPLPAVVPGASEPRPDTLPSLCPYLATPDGNWRSAHAVREHRCLAVTPPVQLTPEKQRRLCLVDGHVKCATFGAALARHAGSAERGSSHSRPIARMAPVILDQGRFDIRIPALRADRLPGQAVLVGLLGIAVVAILLARPSGDGGTTGQLGADTSASPPTSAGPPTDAPVAASTDAPVAAPTDRPAATAEAPVETVEPSGTAAPPGASNAPEPSVSPPPGATAQPATSGTTYRVKSGDTLTAIAARFGTTTQVLIRLNGITDPSKLKIGQILRLP